ncbi:MAG: transcriptional repressor [Ilumatobacteraceae bacterium]|nr:transcriptional repressor [Ilumatobacteraceae bacterium]
MDDRSAEALNRLRRVGGRVTPQRRIVIEALIDAHPHPSAEDVAERIAEVAPEIHLSTVYRTLNTLTELDVITHVHLDHGRSVYHFVDDSGPHLVCRNCGAVAHVPADTFGAVSDEVASATGFTLGHGHFAWSATCPDCTSA